MDLIREKIQTQMGLKMVSQFRITKQKKDIRENYLKQKYEASIAVKKSGMRSINQLSARETTMVARQLQQDDPAYLAFKDKITLFEIQTYKHLDLSQEMSKINSSVRPTPDMRSPPQQNISGDLSSERNPTLEEGGSFSLIHNLSNKRDMHTNGDKQTNLRNIQINTRLDKLMGRDASNSNEK